MVDALLTGRDAFGEDEAWQQHPLASSVVVRARQPRGGRVPLSQAPRTQGPEDLRPSGKQGREVAGERARWEIATARDGGSNGRQDGRNSPRARRGEIGSRAWKGALGYGRFYASVNLFVERHRYLPFQPYTKNLFRTVQLQQTYHRAAQFRN
jgi:hypothetical protein